jgi:indole-3-glycerol phosphate synthase
MQQIDVESIVPSTRDLLQVIATRRKSMALVALLGSDRTTEEALRLHELNVSAFALAEPGPALEAAARATKTVPTLCLTPASSRESFVAARYHGADGVCLDAALDQGAWDRLAKGARTMRMLPIATATDEATVAAAVKAGARALLLRAPTAAELNALAAGAPRAMTLVAEIHGADAATLRALRGHVDAVIVPPAVHAAPDFAELVLELDP